jgi:translation initiation factor 4A
MTTISNNTNMSNTETPETKTFKQWDDVDMNMKLLRGIYAYGFENPSPIQQKALLPMMDGRDIIGQAQSGTGKTGAFTVGTLANIDTKCDFTQAIIISPTHELARQNCNVIRSIGSYMKVRYHLLIGGTPLEQDKKILQAKEQPHVVIGCPGRIHDMLSRSYLDTTHVKMFILDEADEMLSNSFKEQIYKIFKFLNSDVQVGLFSATMPQDVRELTTKFMRNPVKILVDSEMLTLDGLKQYYINVNNDVEKYETLKDLFQMLTVSQTIIYCNSVVRVQNLYDAMRQDEFPVIAIHSSMPHDERHKALEDFKTGAYRVLISSDVTARGIDVQQVSIVINFDVCKNKETYLHRIGRSARWGRKGVAVNFVTKFDIDKVKEFEQYYDTQIEAMPVNFTDHLSGFK